MATTAAAAGHHKTFMEKVLDIVEIVGNRVPHPAVIFVILIGIVIVLSQILYMAGASVSYEVINPETHKLEKVTTVARSLLTAEGIRFMFMGVVQNFMNLQAVGVIIVAMVVVFCQRYLKYAGVGTVVALMLPYVVIICAVWLVLLAIWQLMGLPWGFG